MTLARLQKWERAGSVLIGKATMSLISLLPDMISATLSPRKKAVALIAAEHYNLLDSTPSITTD